MASYPCPVDLRAPDEQERKEAELEAKLLAQEHRFFHVPWNFWHRKQWERDDPRRGGDARVAFVQQKWEYVA